MNKPIKLTFLLMLACLMLLPVNAQNTPEWQSQYAVGLNKLAPHTYVWPYASATDVKKGDYEQSPYYLNLNGKWKFHWVKNPDLRPKDFYKPRSIPEAGQISTFRETGSARDTELPST
jgi:beta-galactosidase